LTTRIGVRGRQVELYVRFVDAAGEPINADDTPKVEIRDSAGTIRQSLTHIGTSLADDPGLYCFTYEIPESAPDGYWVDRWVAEIGNETVEREFDFLVLAAGDIEEAGPPDYTPGDQHIWDFNKDEVYGINKLLRMLKCRVKNDGVRKVPDGQGGYAEVVCSVFTDDELICFLVSALSGFNEYPHFTQFKFSHEQVYTIFAEIIVQGAVLLAFAAQALIERGREFSITDNGVTYQPPAISEILNSQYSAQLADYKEKLKIIKASLKPQPLGLGTFRVTSVNPNYLRLRHLRERQII
jgi:hypothetical protein